MESPFLRRFRHLFLLTCIAIFFGRINLAQAQSRKIGGHVPAAVARLQPARRLGETNLYLTIGLPLRNQEALTNLIDDLYNPANPNFRQWLTSQQFTEQFGPTEEDYQKVVRFAEKHGLKVAGKHANRMVLDVTGAVTNIEKAFNVRMHVYQHPSENRMFYAPDAEPTVDADTPILHVGNLNNYEIARPLLKIRAETNSDTITPYAKTGSGPGGDFTGKDFRAAYAADVAGIGTGQYIAIVDVGGAYYTNDITAYENNAGFPTSIVVSNILLSGFTGVPNGTNVDDGEEALDIEMALSMAPGATILNYQGLGDDVFSRIASDNLAKQITLSYGFGIGDTIKQAFLQFAAQGQTFFQASGDGGADLPGGTGGFTGMPYATIVGGTSLTTVANGGAYISESSWGGSGGGISGYGIPWWQQGISMTLNQGSISNRNYPDVAMLADVVIWWYFKNGQGGTVGGTSASSPEWAGFMALVNEAAANQSKPPVGFLNPVIYGIGKTGGATYANTFHDVTTGNNFNSQNPSKYPAVSGYDLCTGWGSPKGMSTINSLLSYGTNDFTMITTPNGLNIVRGGVTTTLLQVARMNGFAGTVGLSIAGLPAGVTAAFSPLPSTTNTVLLTITVSSTATLGTANATITGTSGALTHPLLLNLTITQPLPNSAQVNLAPYFNRGGMYTDGATFGGGLDGIGAAFSASLLGSHPSLRNVLYNLGTPNGNNFISCAGQIVTLPAAQSSTLQMLVCAINGNQNNQSFTVTYTDNSTTVFTQGISDWFTPQNYNGESIIVPTAYRNNSNGTKDNRTFNLYQYTFTLNPTKTVKSITLPNNGSVMVAAMTVANSPGFVSLASFYNRDGIYTDGTTFSNSLTGGLDGGGAAYSGTLLGGSQMVSNVQFNFGPLNATNVISCANQTVPLPQGKDQSIRLLATGVQGAQASQSFVVTYTDTTTSTFVQSLSDWFVPQGFSGELTNAVIMGHRNSKDGTKDNRTFYLYGYAFKPTAGKTVQSIRLPNNANVIVTSITVVPDSAPIFLANPFTETSVTAGQAYSGTISTNANDFEGDTLTYSKVSGPTWLTLSSSGNLSGTPLSGDVGANSFVVKVADTSGLSSNATMNVSVIAAPSINASMSVQGTNLQLSWSGGIAPYQVETNADLTPGNWGAFGAPTSSTSLLIAPTNAATFFRIVGR